MLQRPSSHTSVLVFVYIDNIKGSS